MTHNIVAILLAKTAKVLEFPENIPLPSSTTTTSVEGELRTDTDDLSASTRTALPTNVEISASTDHASRNDPSVPEGPQGPQEHNTETFETIPYSRDSPGSTSQAGDMCECLQVLLP